MKLRVVQGQNKYDCENQWEFLGRELYEYYCLNLYKMLNSSRHHFYYIVE